MRRDRGDGAKFQRRHASSCGPKGVNCPHPDDAPDHGLWVGRLELPSSGRRRRKEVTAATLDKLNRKLDALRKEFYLHGALPTASQTVEKWLSYWLENIAVQQVRPNTLAGYRSGAKRISEAIGNITLEKLQPAHVRRMHDHITRDNTSTYALFAHRILARALKAAQAEGLVRRNVAALVDAPKKSRLTLNALTVDEAIEIIKAAAPELNGDTDTYDPTPARWATYLLTGMRRGELLGLEWDRVILDPGDSYIDLSWQMQRITDIGKAPADYEYRPIRGTLYWTRPKSSAGWRVIPLVEPLRSILAAHRLRSAPNPYGLVFGGPDGPLDPDTETATWMAYAMETVGRRIRIHDIRHTTVDLLYAASVPEDIIVQIVGHSTVAMSRSYKSRQNRPQLVAAMKQLSASLGYPS